MRAGSPRPSPLRPHWPRPVQTTTCDLSMTSVTTTWANRCIRQRTHPPAEDADEVLLDAPHDSGPGTRAEVSATAAAYDDVPVGRAATREGSPPTQSPPPSGDADVPASSAPYVQKVSRSDDEEPMPNEARPVPYYSPQEAQSPAKPGVITKISDVDDEADVGPYRDPLARHKQDTDELILPDSLQPDAPGRHDEPKSPQPLSGAEQ